MMAGKDNNKTEDARNTDENMHIQLKIPTLMTVLTLIMQHRLLGKDEVMGSNPVSNSKKALKSLKNPLKVRVFCYSKTSTKKRVRNKYEISTEHCLFDKMFISLNFSSQSNLAFIFFSIKQYAKSLRNRLVQNFA